MERLRNREAGFTIVEVLVATLILVIGALATFRMLSDAVKNTARAKATQVALDLAQQEIEALRSLSNEQLAMTAVPPHSTDSLDPRYRVNSSAGTFALTREPVGSYLPLVHNGGAIEGVGTSEEGKFIEKGVVNPGPTRSPTAMSAARSIATSSGATTNVAERMSGPAGLQADRRRRQARHARNS